MTTPRTPVTSRTRIFIPFIILPDSKDEDTTLPVRSAPLPPLPLFKEMEHDIGIPQDDIGSSYMHCYHRIISPSNTKLPSVHQPSSIITAPVQWQCLLGSSQQEIVALRASVETLEHQYRTGDRVRLQRVEMTEQDVEALDAWAEATEQQAEALQISLGATQIDITDLLESRRDDRLEMAEL
ncbi:hypothetical protein Tco_1198609 [Tanacetum coccineum]